MNNRRKLVIALGAGALVAPFGSFAQQLGKVWRVGFLSPRSRPVSIDTDFTGGFAQGMRERGYIEGKNLTIECRFGDGDFTRLPALAAELVQLNVDALIGGGPQVIRALKQATTTIPIVMGVSGDPVVEGFVASLARPGSNITGAMVNAGDICDKRLQWLLDISLKLSRVAYLMNSGNLNHVAALAQIQAAGQKKVKILAAEARTSKDIEAVFAFIRREKAEAIIMPPDAIFNSRMGQIAELALKQRLPLISGIREYVEAGCLMSYGASFTDNFYRAAYYLDRIFKGAKLADLPVEQPTKFELFINGKTAKTLGLKIPQSLLIMVDRVTE